MVACDIRESESRTEPDELNDRRYGGTVLTYVSFVSFVVKTKRVRRN